MARVGKMNFIEEELVGTRSVVRKDLIRALPFVAQIFDKILVVKYRLHEIFRRIDYGHSVLGSVPCENRLGFAQAIVSELEGIRKNYQHDWDIVLRGNGIEITHLLQQNTPSL